MDLQWVCVKSCQAANALSYFPNLIRKQKLDLIFSQIHHNKIYANRPNIPPLHL